MTGEKLNGYLDRLRENVEALDEAIANARTMSKSKKKGDNPLQWTKTLRDLVELRNATLANIKAHLLGRDETGAIVEPQDFWDSNQQVMYEREFKRQLTPWTLQDLKIKCEKCGIESDSTRTRVFERFYTTNDCSKYIEHGDQDLCDGCYEKTLQEVYAQVKEAREQAGWKQ